MSEVCSDCRVELTPYEDFYCAWRESEEYDWEDEDE